MPKNMTSDQTPPVTKDVRPLFGMSERLGVAILIAAVLLAYGNSLVNDFSMDDNLYILTNPMVTNFSLRGIFHASALTNVFRPLVFGAYALNWFLGGGKAFAFHLFSVLLHGAVTVLLYFVLRRLLEPFPRAAEVAWVAALLFAVHPIHTEAVASATNSSELMAMGFLLLAWSLHMSDRPVLVLVCFALAMLAKESAVVFVPLVVIGDYVRGRWKSLWRYGSVGVVGLIYVAILRQAQGGKFGERSVSFLDNPLAHFPVGMRIANALRIAWRYVGLHVYPATLSCDYSYNEIRLYSQLRHNLPAIIATALVLAAWGWALTSGRRTWFLAGAIYICGFSVTSNVLVATGTIMGERLAYLPSAGFCLIVALAWMQVEESKYRRAAWVALILVVAALGVRTAVRNRDWRNNFTLFVSGIKAAPDSAKMHTNVAFEYYFRGDLDTANAQLTRALQIYPDIPDAVGYKALIVSQRGNDEEAARLLKDALRNTLRDNPNYDFMSVNLAAVEMKLGHNDDALKLLEDDIGLWPRSSRAYSNRGVIFYDKSDFGRARMDAETALRLDPNNVQAVNLLRLLAHP